MADKSFTKKAIAAAVLSAAMAVSFITASALGDTTDTNADNDTLFATDAIHTDDILETAGIELDGNDEVIRTDENGAVSMTILKAFDVTVIYNGQAYAVTMTKGTVADALKLAKIELKKDEKVTPSLDTEVNKDTEITVDNSVKVKVTFNGIQDTYTVPNGNVQQALESLGVKMDKFDKVAPKRSTKLTEGMEISYTDVEYEKVTQTKAVKFKTKKVYKKNLKKGYKKIATKGELGEKTIVIREIYHDGELVDSEQISSEITKKPVTQVVLIGTKQVKKKSKKTADKKTAETQQEKAQNETSENTSAGGNTFTDSAGNTVSYSQVLTGSGTAYTAPAGSGTATGVTVSVGCVAVNPYIIPYGSRLYIESVDGSYVYGYATAVDTGGALMDGSAIVDLFMNTYDDCAVFGRRDVNVYVLN